MSHVVCGLFRLHPVQELLIHLEAFLRVALTKFDVNQTSIKRLLQVTAVLNRRGASTQLAPQTQNHIAVALLDVLSDACHGKVALTTPTLTTLFDVSSLFSDARRSHFRSDSCYIC